MVLFLSESDVQALTTMPEALEIVEAAFGSFARGQAAVLPAASHALPGTAGVLRVLAATMPAEQFFGLKTLTGFPGRRLEGEIYFVILLFGMATGALRAVVSANHLTGLRTGAASGVAAKYLAREDAHSLGVVGAGVQAWYQVEGLAAVRQIREAKVFSRHKSKAEVFAARLRRELAVDAVAVDTAEAAVRDSDLVIAATTASSPVIQGEWLKLGAHVSGIGANTRGKQELDAACFARARVVADVRAQVLEECGDLRSAVESGRVSADVIYAELGELIEGTKQGRSSPDEVTIFKSVGLALQDIAIAASIYEAAPRRGLGSPIWAAQ
jgi:ornithine cyclodeaminase/alanine dehydrogenase-like protein (mu-crystallin family)